MAWAASAETPAAGTIGTMRAKGLTRPRRVSSARASRARISATDGGSAMASDPQHHELAGVAGPAAGTLMNRLAAARFMTRTGGDRRGGVPGPAESRIFGRIRL